MSEKLLSRAFTDIEPPVFTGKPEVLSVKVPSDLKKVLRQYGKLRGRGLSEVAQFALEEYAKGCASAVKAAAKKNDSARKR